MKYEIFLKPSAIADLDELCAHDASCVEDAMETFLEHSPTRQSKSRIKRLRGVRNPDYRLRIGEFRVFYIVDENTRRVEVLRVMHKDQTATYYKELLP